MNNTIPIILPIMLQLSLPGFWEDVAKSLLKEIPNEAEVIVVCMQLLETREV
jgi:hypothetical protein